MQLLLSTKKLDLANLGDDFREAERQHSIVFWTSFAVFLASLLGDVAAALVFKHNLSSIGGLAAVSGVIGAFSYKMLAKSRLARISLALFNSYIIELQDRLDSLMDGSI